MQTIEQIAERIESARQRHRSLAMQNSYGLLPEEMVRLTVAYRTAEAELIAAKLDMDDAVKAMAETIRSKRTNVCPNPGAPSDAQP